MPTTIRTLELERFSIIWPLFRSVIQGGDTYALSPDTTMEEARLGPGV